MSLITNFTRISLWLVITAVLGGILVFSSAYLYLSPKLPSVDVLKDVKLQTPLRIYSRDGMLIGEFGEKKREPIEFDRIPKDFINAILAAEDDRFYSHPGVDLRGLLRAATQLVASGSIQSGGSTITMQVAKNYFLTRDRTFIRKFNEILLALQIERELPKEEILELYLNKIFLGNRAYGIQAAAQVYYGTNIDQLSLAQMAMIAALPKAPSALNPLSNPARASLRRNWILGRMLELGYINGPRYQLAVQEPITATFHGSPIDVNAPYVSEMARKEMVERYGQNAYTDGYQVFTTVDSQLQLAAQQAVVDGLVAYDLRHGYRGPEKQLTLPEDEASVAEFVKAEIRGMPRLANMYPAIVTVVHEQAFNAIVSDGTEIIVEWDSGLKDVQKYIDVNRISRKPRTASDIVSAGDLIRVVQRDDQSWTLSQVPAAQAALVSLDANNGGILSMVGGFDYKQSKFNRTLQAARQPGSNFKPFIYTAALDKGFTAASTINDAPIVFEDDSLENTWRPTNSSGKFFGPTRLRQALYKSRNLVSIRLLRSLGINSTIDYVGRFGFNISELPKDLSLALGSHSMTPMEIVSAYSILANGGYKVNAHLIDRIEDVSGETIFQATPVSVCRDCELAATEAEEVVEADSIEDILNPEPVEPSLPQAERVVDERTAFIIDSILKDVVKKGTARRALVLGRDDLAGKTGTTNGPTDAWFSGYGGDIVTTAWLGFDNNGILGRREYGGSAALPIWIDYMRSALKGVAEVQRPQPTGIVSVRIDPETGMLAKPGQSDAIFEIFRAENAPSTIADNQGSESKTLDQDEIIEQDIF